MKYSPYRNYIEGEFSDEDQICFIRIIDTDDVIEDLENRLSSLLAGSRFRIDKRPQHRMEGYSGLYFYNAEATVERSMEELVRYMEEKTGQKISPVDMTGSSQYVSEKEAIALLNRVRSIYEPIKKPWK